MEGLQTGDGGTRDSLQTLNDEKIADEGGPIRRRKRGETVGPWKCSHS